MSFTYDITTDIGKVRLLSTDVSAATPVFQDAEMDAFVSLETGVKRAAALALETMASNEVLVLKVMSLLEITTDGAKVSDALLKRAAVLRKQADDEDVLLVGLLEDTPFVIAEQVFDSFGYRQQIVNAALRGEY